MRVFVTPDRVELGDDNAVEVLVTVHNTGTLIGGYHLRVLGADPSWVTLETENLSLFPDASETVTGAGADPAGRRRRRTPDGRPGPGTDPAAGDLDRRDRADGARRPRRCGCTLTPMTVIGGRSGTFGVVLENTGNTTDHRASWPAPTPRTSCGSSSNRRCSRWPPATRRSPTCKATGPRRWFGQPVVRTFGLLLRPPAATEPATSPHRPGARRPVPAIARPPGRTAGRARRRRLRPAAPALPPEPLATGTLLQKARLSRGALSLLSLLFAATVFATVITIALTALVGQSAADRDLAIQVAAARNSGGAGRLVGAGRQRGAADQRGAGRRGLGRAVRRRGQPPPR